MEFNMFDWLRNRFKKVQLEDLPLEFTLDTDDNGKYIAEVYTVLDGKREKVKDIKKIWNYGFTIEDENKRYIISTKNLEILLSIRSLNPIVYDDGKMIFDVCPPQLRYLRTQENIKESAKSKEIKILEKPLEYGAKVDYELNKELIVETGYLQEGNDKLISSQNLNKTPYGGYVRFDNTFFPLPQDVRPDNKKWLDIPSKIIPLDNIPDFFKRDLVLIKSQMKAVLTENAMKIKVVERNFEPIVHVNVNEPGWLDFKIDYKIGEYQLPHQMFRKCEDKYIHPDDFTWIKVDNKTIQNTEKYLKQLDIQETPEGFRTPIIQFVSIEDFIEHIGGMREVNSEYQRFLHEITDFKSDENFTLPSKMESALISNDIKLRPYQRAGIHWLSWLLEHHLNGILADDMGLGKTMQTIAALGMLYQENEVLQHSLIICPKSVVPFWAREIRRCSPDLRIYEYVGSLRNKNVFKNDKPLIFITTYETASKDIEIIRSIPFFCVVLDEATRIKNPDAQRSKSIKEINAVHRIALSGTPIENRPAELWSLFDFLMKGHLGTYGNFIRKFETPIISGNDDIAAQNLSKRIRPFILRRLKKDVAKDLPEKIEMDEWCNLTDEQRSLYSQIQERYVSPIRTALLRGEKVDYTSSILPILTKLKQVCDHPALITKKFEPVSGRSEKFDIAIEKVEEIHGKGEHVVIFSHFLNTLDLLEMALKERRIEYIRIDGSTRDRQILIDQFNNGQVDAALCSIQACGQGITLTAANHVIHIDRWWNPAIEDQATDRVHRIGQDKTVYVYRITNTGTLEEKIALLLEKKRNISDKIIGGAIRQKMQWTREELLELLKPLE